MRGRVDVSRYAISPHGVVLVHCFVGCTFEAICPALGVEPRDLFPDDVHEQRVTRTSGSRKVYTSRDDAIKAVAAQISGKPVAGWCYHRADDSVAFWVVRFETAEGKQYRPIHEADFGWTVGDPPGQLPLYCLPTLSGASRVYVCEGEKAVDAGAQIGLTATTSAHGAKSAAKTEWRPLAGRDVVIVPDNDDGGRRYADAVAAILMRLSKPATVSVLALPDLPPKGDMLEFIEARRASGRSDDDIKTEIEALAEGLTELTEAPSVSFVSGEGRGSESFWPPPQPLPDDLPPVMPFSFDLLPASLRPRVQDIHVRIQCPPDFPAVGTMVGLATVLGRKVGIRPKRQDDWTVVANLWGACIGRPGVIKTGAVEEALKPVKRLEVAAAEQFKQVEQDYTAEQLVAKERRKVAEQAMRAAIKEGQDATDIAKEVLDQESERPTRRRYILNDSSVEKLGEILRENPNGVLVYRDELIGLLRSLDKDGQEGARAFYLEAWNGTGRFTYDRIGRGTIDIEAACVSVLGSIQPGPLSDYLRSAARGGAGDDGLIQRFQLAVWPDIACDWKNIDSWPDRKAKEGAFRVFERLDALNPSNIGAEKDDHDDIPYLRFTAEAQHGFDCWREKLERRIRSREEHPAFESHLGKYRSLIPSLALLIHLADDGSGPVELHPLLRAIRWGEYLETHAHRLLSAFITPDTHGARVLARHIMAGHIKEGFALRDVYRHCWSGLATRGDAVGAVELLEDLDWLRATRERTPGAPRTSYQINPLLMRTAKTFEPLGGGTDKTDIRLGDTLLSVMSVPVNRASEDFETASARAEPALAARTASEVADYGNSLGPSQGTDITDTSPQAGEPDEAISDLFGRPEPSKKKPESVDVNPLDDQELEI